MCSLGLIVLKLCFNVVTVEYIPIVTIKDYYPTFKLNEQIQPTVISQHSSKEIIEWVTILKRYVLGTYR